MASIKKASISRKKKDIQPSKEGYLGTKHIRFNHQASLGDTSFNMLTLVNGIPGFNQPNGADLLSIYAFRHNLRIYSSLDYELIPQKDYEVNGSTITFINDLGAIGAQEGEIFIGEVQIPTSNAIVADAQNRKFKYTLPQGQTTLPIAGYTIGENEIAVYRNGKLQDDENYSEVDNGNGFGASIEFNTANQSFNDTVVVHYGLAFAGDTQIFADLERLSGSILELAKDLSLASERPIGDYLAATPSEIERNTFGNNVLNILNAEIPYIGPWSDWEPIGLTSTGSTPTKGPVVTDRVRFRQVGEDYEVDYQFQNSAPGTAGTGLYILLLPSNIKFSEDQLFADLATGSGDGKRDDAPSAYIGQGWIGDGGTGGEFIAFARAENSFVCHAKSETTDAFGNWDSGFYDFASSFGFNLRLKFKGKGLVGTKKISDLF